MQIQDVIKLTDQKSVALIGDTQNAKYLNKVYKILKEYKHNNLTIYTSGSKRSGTIIVEKLINKDYKK